MFSMKFHSKRMDSEKEKKKEKKTNFTFPKLTLRKDINDVEPYQKSLCKQ